MKILFAAGGTAGHINPALAIASYIRERRPQAEILFIGNCKGMEAELIPKAGFDFEGVPVSGFERKLTLKNIYHNIGSFRRMFVSSAQAKKIIQKFQPDIAIGTGGYASGPVIRKAVKLGVPAVIHEQNAYPGMTTKLLAPLAKTVMLAVPEAEKFLDPNAHYVLTGNPLRSGITTYPRERARQELGMDSRPLVVSFGGSLGARHINAAVTDLLRWSFHDKSVQNIHATGKSGWETMSEALKEDGIHPGRTDNIWLREYIDDMPRCLAAADLVICRAGAITLSELQAQGKAAILIPSPNVAENHQYHNAMALVSRGAAALIEDKDLTGERLIEVVKRLTAKPEKLHEMGRKAQETAILDSCERIYTVITDVLNQAASAK
ncbi:MAG: undecaprenyldiphospho-muramoylpentapeptide beta-N-acetylglucosaminyltransferase [Clostridiales bacterium]|nr:undecaprenyldiphospho-muramoylpentapeptide beta-N-acetylglucosaminyltransferase [Clostridiales bacterium]